MYKIVLKDSWLKKKLLRDNQTVRQTLLDCISWVPSPFGSYPLPLPPPPTPFGFSKAGDEKTWILFQAAFTQYPPSIRNI